MQIKEAVQSIQKALIWGDWNRTQADALRTLLLEAKKVEMLEKENEELRIRLRKINESRFLHDEAGCSQFLQKVDDNLIYDKIKEKCKERGVSVTSIEKRAGLSNGLISKWNNSTPSVENLKAVADALETTVDELLK